MKTLLILPLFLGSIVAFSQSEIHFLNCDETNKNCTLNLSEVEELQLKHYNQARIFFFESPENGVSSQLAVVNGLINFQIPDKTNLVLVKLKNDTEVDHLWLPTPTHTSQNRNYSSLIHAALWAGAHQELTELITDFELANKYFETYKADSSSNKEEEKLYSKYYWQAQASQNPNNTLAQMVARSRETKDPDEMNLLIKEMTNLGDTLYSQELSDKLLNNFPEHPISIEMNTWELRRQSYLSKDGALNYDLYKEYLKRTANYRSKSAQRRIENHKAQFLVNLYQHYWDMQYDWYREVAELSPTNQVYVFSITARSLMETSILEAYDLVDRALEIDTDKLVADLKKEMNTSLLNNQEENHRAEKCKDLAYYLKGNLWLSENEDESALLAFEKAVTLNGYIVDDYNVAYAKALTKSGKVAELKSFLSKVSAVYPLSPVLQEIATAKSQKDFEDKKHNMAQLSFTDEKGQIFELGNNTLELLDVWNSDCEPCMKDFPNLYFLQMTFPDDLSILSVSIDDAKIAQSTLSNRGFDNFVTLSPNLKVTLQNTYEFEGNRAKILLDKNGNVIFKKAGAFSASDYKELQAIVAKFLRDEPSK